MMYGRSDDNCLDSVVCSIVKQAILLEENYNDMLLQGDEVDLRIQLWRDTIDICKTDPKRTSCICIQHI
jgi:hypothetical protein